MTHYEFFELKKEIYLYILIKWNEHATSVNGYTILMTAGSTLTGIERNFSYGAETQAIEVFKTLQRISQNIVSIADFKWYLGDILRVNKQVILHIEYWLKVNDIVVISSNTPIIERTLLL